MEIANASTLKVAAGTPATIAGARKYLGMVLHTDGTNAAIAIAYKGSAATGGKEVGACRGAIGADDHDAPMAQVDLEADGGLHVVVTGTGAFALVRYST